VPGFHSNFKVLNIFPQESLKVREVRVVREVGEVGVAEREPCTNRRL
jgi:hypothetical protein